MFKIKRTTDPPESGDGFRVLIDRVWPRDVNKGEVSMDLWLKEIAPSTELGQWFAHNPEKWEEFQRRYARELDTWPQLTTLLKVESADGPATRSTTKQSRSRPICRRTERGRRAGSRQ